jgi:hypothetical protein
VPACWPWRPPNPSWRYVRASAEWSSRCCHHYRAAEPAQSASSFTILQHLAPQSEPLSRKFHTFHFPAICSLFKQLLVFAGLIAVGMREACFAGLRTAMGG